MLNYWKIIITLINNNNNEYVNEGSEWNVLIKHDEK